MSPSEHMPVVQIDSGLHNTLHRIEEVGSVVRGVEAYQIVAQQPVYDLPLPGAQSEYLGVRPRYVPELRHDYGRVPLLQIAGQQREVVVLDEYDCRLVAHLLQDAVGKETVDPFVGLPVRLFKYRFSVGYMA